MANHLRVGGRRWAAPLVAGSLVAAAGLVAGGSRATGAPGADRDQRRVAKVQNVILFVGDGMGIGARDAGRLAAKGLDRELVMDSLPVAGMARTHSDDPETFVTDSAAAGTSLATGVKTFNGAIGVDADGERVRTLLERAERKGMSTGVVTTAQVTDATPAAFGSHVQDRAEQSAIARQLIERTGVDVILGGGEDYWFPAGNPGAYPDAPAEDPTEGSRSDRGNLVERAEELGYTYVSDAAGLQAASGRKLLGLFANQEMFQQRGETAGAVYDPVVPLRSMARKAVDILSQDKDGFFLLVEEEAIDEMAHRNNAPLMIKGVRQLDRAVRLGKRFAARDQSTLVVVTADHETGGATVEQPDLADETGTAPSTEDGPFAARGSSYQFFVDWTTGQHTDADVPVMAMGPGSGRLDGTYQNTHIHDAIRAALFG
jgi:alkaline phosphatase